MKEGCERGAEGVEKAGKGVRQAGTVRREMYSVYCVQVDTHTCTTPALAVPVVGEPSQRTHTPRP